MLLIRWCTLTPSPHRRHVSPHLGGVTRTLCAFCTTRSDYSRKLDSPITGSPDSSKKNWFARTQIYAPLLPILAFSIEIVTSILQIMQISYFMFTVVDSLPPPPQLLRPQYSLGVVEYRSNSAQIGWEEAVKTCNKELKRFPDILNKSESVEDQSLRTGRLSRDRWTLRLLPAHCRWV